MASGRRRYETWLQNLHRPLAEAGLVHSIPPLPRWQHGPVCGRGLCCWLWLFFCGLRVSALLAAHLLAAQTLRRANTRHAALINLPLSLRSSRGLFSVYTGNSCGEVAAQKTNPAERR